MFKVNDRVEVKTDYVASADVKAGDRGIVIYSSCFSNSFRVKMDDGEEWEFDEDDVTLILNNELKTLFPYNSLVQIVEPDSTRYNVQGRVVSNVTINNVHYYLIEFGSHRKYVDEQYVSLIKNPPTSIDKSAIAKLVTKFQLVIGFILLIMVTITSNNIVTTLFSLVLSFALGIAAERLYGNK